MNQQSFVYKVIAGVKYKVLISLTPVRLIERRWRNEWEDFDRRSYVSGARVTFALFFFAYLLHFFLIDIPLGKSSIDVWAKYRFGLSTAALIGFGVTSQECLLRSKLLRLPLFIAGLLFSLMQAKSMTWRAEVPYVYSVIIPVIAAIGLRISVISSIGYLLLNYAVEFPFWQSRTTEMPYIVSASMVGILFVGVFRAKAMSEIKLFISQQLQIEAKSDLVQVAAQVAHDIRSPLGALKSLERAMSGESSERILLRSVIGRINDIANEMLSKHRLSNGDLSEQYVPRTQVAPVLRSLIAEKRLEYADRPEVKIEFLSNRSFEEAGICVPVMEFQRVISNIINNSYEAIRGPGHIQIVGTVLPNEHVRIVITDNGTGTSEPVAHGLLQRRTPNGKKTGNGLGLPYCKRKIEGWNGSMAFSSKVGQGASVAITLPNA